MIVTKFPYERPSKEDVKAYLDFATACQESADKKTKARGKKKQPPVEIHKPCLRNRKTTLIPSLQTIPPCNICADAQYNQLCHYAKYCAALLYAGIIGLSQQLGSVGEAPDSIIKNIFRKE